jgi:hypothetical protein
MMSSINITESKIACDYIIVDAPASKLFTIQLVDFHQNLACVIHVNQQLIGM